MRQTVRRHLAGSMACMLTAVFITHPTLGSPTAPIDRSTTEPVLAAPAEVPPVVVEAAEAEARLNVEEQLIALGETAAAAAYASRLLTEADLEVLVANPKMMQIAGTSNEQTRNLILGLLFLGGLIALAAASDGSSSIMTNTIMN